MTDNIKPDRINVKKTEEGVLVTSNCMHLLLTCISKGV